MMLEKNLTDGLLILLIENKGQIRISQVKSNRHATPLFLQLCTVIREK